MISYVCLSYRLQVTGWDNEKPTDIKVDVSTFIKPLLQACEL